MRFVRDEQAWLDRRASLQRRCDLEAAEGMQNLMKIGQDIDLKTENRDKYIKEKVLDPLHEHFKH